MALFRCGTSNGGNISNVVITASCPMTFVGNRNDGDGVIRQDSLPAEQTTTTLNYPEETTKSRSISYKHGSTEKGGYLNTWSGTMTISTALEGNTLTVNIGEES